MIYEKTSKEVIINGKKYIRYNKKNSRKIYVKYNNKYEAYTDLKQKLEKKKKTKGGQEDNSIHESNIPYTQKRMQCFTKNCKNKSKIADALECYNNFCLRKIHDNDMNSFAL